MVKRVLIARAGTVTLDGIWAAVLCDHRSTHAPPTGAGPLNVTGLSFRSFAKTGMGHDVPAKQGLPGGERSRKHDPKKRSARKGNRNEEVRELLRQDTDLVKALVQEVVQPVLEAEIEEALDAAKGERIPNRLAIGRATTAAAWSPGWASRSCGCPRAGRDASARRSLSATGAAKRPR